MGLGAILVVGEEHQAFCSTPRAGNYLLGEPIECVEILGRSMLERTIERFARTEIEAITVLASNGYSVPVLSGMYRNVNVWVVGDVASAISQLLQEYSQKGIEHSFVVAANVYAEIDLLDLFYFHREARKTATRGLDREGPLDLWVVDCAKAQQVDLESFFNRADEATASYLIRDYVSRLRHPRDLRRLVSDALCGRCAMRPSGREIKPGIWAEENAEIHRGARIVAPAYIGSGSRVREDTLITRCTSIEKNCYVDCGTVIENSSILANTHIGIWLDVCHAVASGEKFVSLGHDVVVEISDPSIMRSNSDAKKGVEFSRPYAARQIVATIQQEQPPSPEMVLGANLIQG